jgi:hypothetical protein
MMKRRRFECKSSLKIFPMGKINVKVKEGLFVNNVTINVLHVETRVK